jgi:hypothetical protein
MAFIETGLTCSSLRDRHGFLALLSNALSIAAKGGRDQVFETLSRSAGAIAKLDGGDTLWAIWTSLAEVEGWWSATSVGAL